MLYSSANSIQQTMHDLNSQHIKKVPQQQQQQQQQFLLFSLSLLHPFLTLSLITNKHFYFYPPKLLPSSSLFFRSSSSSMNVSCPDHISFSFLSFHSFSSSSSSSSSSKKRKHTRKEGRKFDCCVLKAEEGRAERNGAERRDTVSDVILLKDEKMRRRKKEREIFIDLNILFHYLYGVLTRYINGWMDEEGGEGGGGGGGFMDGIRYTI